MLDCLRCSEKASIQSGLAFVLLHYLSSFVQDALDRLAFLAARRFAEKFENLLKAFELPFGFIVVFFECGPQLLRRLRFVDLLFGVINVLQRIEKQCV
jgi:hypothetical protein